MLPRGPERGGGSTLEKGSDARQAQVRVIYVYPPGKRIGCSTDLLGSQIRPSRTF